MLKKRFIGRLLPPNLGNRGQTGRILIFSFVFHHCDGNVPSVPGSQLKVFVVGGFKVTDQFERSAHPESSLPVNRVTKQDEHIHPPLVFLTSNNLYSQE